MLQGANTMFKLSFHLSFSCLSLALEVCTTSLLSLVSKKNIVTHETAMVHFSNTVLRKNAEWSRRGWVRAYEWVL